MMKRNLNRAGLLLLITLGLPLALMILFVISLMAGDADTALALFLLCTMTLYVSLGAGLLVPVWMGIVLLAGGSVERPRIVKLLLVAVLNIAVAVAWIFFYARQFGFRW